MDRLQTLRTSFLIMHIFGVFSCLIQDVIIAPLGYTLLTLIIIDLAFILLYLGTVVEGMVVLFSYFGYQNSSDLDCYRTENLEKLLGMAFSWIYIEVLVYYTFLLTMMLCLIKA